MITDDQSHTVVNNNVNNCHDCLLGDIQTALDTEHRNLLCQPQYAQPGQRTGILQCLLKQPANSGLAVQHVFIVWIFMKQKLG